MPVPHPSRGLLYVVIFVTSFAVMSLELASSRLLMPHFGSSIFVWGTLISVVLLALSVGYWVGGRLADRRSPRHLLAVLLLGAGVWVALADLAAAPLLTKTVTLGVIGGTLLVTVLLFLAPMAALGAMTPAILKMRIDDPDTVGAASGSVFFLSSLGSIAGTVATTFVGIPLLGTTRTIAILAALLTALGAVVLPRRRGLAALMALAIVPTAVLPPPLAPPIAGLLFEAESPYQYVRVAEIDGQRFLLLNHDRPFSSFNSFLGPELLTGYYFDDLALAPAMAPAARRALVLGMGAGTVVGQMHVLYPDLVIDAVELDEVVVRVARDYFGLPEDERVRVFAAGGRAFLQGVEERYDTIVVDVFQNGPYIPFHFSTREFYALVAARLAPGGLLVVNIEVVEEPLLNAIAAALPHVLTVRRGSNVVTYASQSALAFPAAGDPRVPPALAATAQRAREKAEAYVGQPAPLFTDDHAPVELLVALHEL